MPSGRIVGPRVVSADGGAHLGARALGFRLVGARFAYLLHTRPAEWPIMAAHTLLGAVLAIGVGPLLQGESLASVLRALLAWVVCLNGGTLAINSAFDKDEGDIAYLRSPPAPPRHLFAFGLALMFLGAAIALALPVAFRALYALCFVMSVLYSVPPFRLKAVAGFDWLINLVGFGAITPLAGWVATGRSVTAAGWWIIAGFGALFAALYPLTQLYQFEEDQRRGDRTFALVLGMRRSLDVAIGATAVAFWCFGVAGWLGGLGSWQWASLGAALLAWALVLVPWRRAWPSRTPAEHQRGMHLALAAWAVTDVAVVLGWGL